MQRFTPQLIDAARPCRHAVGGQWFVDETYVKIAGSWRYVYRAVDQHGQVIDVFVSPRRDTAAATRFFAAALGDHGLAEEITTDKAHALARAIAVVAPGARHDTSQYATTEWKQTTGDSRHGFVACVGSNTTAPPR